MRKKRTIAKSRAASLKGWRTKQRMQQERKLVYPPWDITKEFLDALDPSELHGQAGKNQAGYMRRALPNPWLEIK
jgi:hypothetical protein